MHSWGDEGVDWQGINDAAEFIGEGLKRYVRVGVQQYKEKFGTVRVYCRFGWYGLYDIYRPGYCWYPRWWPIRLDHWVASTGLWALINKLVVALHQQAYVFFYCRAVVRWPHLYEEIVSSADYGELFEGITFAGQTKAYKHSDYWTTV